MTFTPGWHPDVEAQAKADWKDSPPRFGSEFFQDVDISQPAFTLADQIKFWYDQGQVGSCFANATAQALQIGISTAISNGAQFTDVQLSRAWVWYYGRKLDGSLGSRSDGGSITNSLRAVHENGICPESFKPYKPSHNWLEQAPSAAAVSAAKAYSIQALVDLDYGDTNGIKKSIKSGLPPVIGIWWPYGWDSSVDSSGIVTGIGSGVYGHALCLIGWATWNSRTYWHICNSHGPIYHTLPSTTVVPGFVGSSATATYAFWVPDDYLKTVAGYGNAEMVAPVGMIAPASGAGVWTPSWIGGAS